MTQCVTMPVISRAMTEREHHGPRVWAGRMTVSDRCVVAAWLLRGLCRHCIVLLLCCELSAQDVDDEKYDDPDRVDEVPVEREDFESFGVFFVDAPVSEKTRA